MGPLKQIIIQGTPLCNLNCDYCYLTSEARRKHEPLTHDTAKVVFDKVFLSSITDNCSGFDVCWHAGEPLVQPVSYYKEIFSIIEQSQIAHNKQHIQITHSIQTNGTLINDEWCRFFREFDVDVSISVDGPAWLHDKHRKNWSGNGSHAKVMRGFECFKKHGLSLGAFSVITKDTLAHAEEWFHFFIDNDIENVCFNIDEIQADNARSSMNGYGMEEEFRLFLKKIWELNKQQIKPLYIREFQNAARMLLHPGMGNGANDSYSVPFQMLNVDSKGNFSTFCPTLLTAKSKEYGDFIIGNLHTDTFESALQTDKLKRITEDIRAGASMCEKECEYYELCGGLIWQSNKYAEHGTFLSTETMTCRLRFKTLLNVVVDDVLAENALSLPLSITNSGLETP
jgi:uncharacterized protein